MTSSWGNNGKGRKGEENSTKTRGENSLTSSWGNNGKGRKGEDNSTKTRGENSLTSSYIKTKSSKPISKSLRS